MIQANRHILEEWVNNNIFTKNTGQSKGMYETSKNSVKAILLLIALLGFSGCSMFGKCASLNVQVSEGMNGGGTPITLLIYQLRDKSIMEKAEFEIFWKKEEEDKRVLGKQLLRRREERIYPNKNEIIKIKREKDAKYIAVVGIFREPDDKHGKWKRIFELNSWAFGCQNFDLIIGMHKIRLGIVEQEEEKEREKEEEQKEEEKQNDSGASL